MTNAYAGKYLVKQQIANIFVVTLLNLIAASPQFAQNTTVMIMSTNGNLRISTDGGNNWINKGNPISTTTYDLAIAPGDTREIFLATSSGVFYSNDSIRNQK